MGLLDGGRDVRVLVHLLKQVRGRALREAREVEVRETPDADFRLNPEPEATRETSGLLPTRVLVVFQVVRGILEGNKGAVPGLRPRFLPCWAIYAYRITHPIPNLSTPR